MNASVPASALSAVALSEQSLSELSALPLIEQWVSFASVSRDSNLPLIDWTEAHLRALGVTDMRRTYDDSGKKCNLWVTLPAHDGESKVGGLVLSGHTDVVPVDGQPWDTDPFTVVHKDGRLYGRGVTDMKSFGATALMMVPELLRRKLKRPVYLAFSYDEEVGCIGVRRLIADMVAQGYNPAGCIVGEPTGMQVVIAHKESTPTEPRCVASRRIPRSRHWASTRWRSPANSSRTSSACIASWWPKARSIRSMTCRTPPSTLA